MGLEVNISHVHVSRIIIIILYYIYQNMIYYNKINIIFIKKIIVPELERVYIRGQIQRMQLCIVYHQTTSTL